MSMKNRNIWAAKDKELVILILGREGGKTTARIIDSLLEKPYNKNQLTNILHLDYNTITYHTDLLCKHGYATKEKFENSYYYHPSNKLFNHIDDYILIKEVLK